MPVTNDNLSLIAKRRKSVLQPVTKASGFAGAVFMSETPIRIVNAKILVCVTFAGTGLTAGDVDLGIAASGTEICSASGAAGATDAAGTILTNAVTANRTGFTGYFLPANTPIHLTATARAGAGTYVVVLEYEEVETDQTT